MQQHRQQLIVAGLAQVATDGVEVGIPHVTLDGLAAQLGLTTTEAVAAWSDHDDHAEAEERLQRAVLARVLDEQPGVGDNGISEGGLSDTAEAVTAVMAVMPDLDALDPEERGVWLRRVIRAGTLTNHSMADRSQIWQSYVAIMAAVLSRRPPDPTLEAAWRSAEQGGASRYLNLYTAMAQIFGLRLRYCYTWEQFATAVIALSEGMMVRSTALPHVRSLERVTGADGAPEDWNLFGVCFEALVHQFFDADPDGPATDFAHESAG